MGHGENRAGLSGDRQTSSAARHLSGRCERYERCAKDPGLATHEVLGWDDVQSERAGKVRAVVCNPQPCVARLEALGKAPKVVGLVSRSSECTVRARGRPT